MDPQTLPAEAQELYRRIKDRYTIGFESFRPADDLHLHLLKVTDLEQLLAGKDPLKKMDRPFGLCMAT